MAEIVNLRNVRKQKARKAKAVQADQNRALFGRTKAEKLRQSAEKSASERHLAGHKKDGPEQP